MSISKRRSVVGRGWPVAIRRALYVAWLSVPTLVLAQEPMPPSKGADAWFEEGKAALKRGDWSGACDCFRRSLELDPSPSTHVKIARCHEHDGRSKAASDSYAQALRLLADRPRRDAHSRELEALARRSKEAVDTRLGRLELRLVPRPSRYQVIVDGQRLEAAPNVAAIILEPGFHTVAVEAPGYMADPSTVTLPVGGTREVILELRPLASGSARPPTATGSPDSMNPSTAASNAAPAYQAPPSAKVATALGTDPTRAAQRAQLSPNQGDPNRTKSKMTPATSSSAGEGRGQRIAAGLCGGAGLVTFGFAAALGYKAKTLVDDARIDNRCDANFACNTEGKALMDKAERRQTYALLLTAGGTVLVGTGLALWLTAPSGSGKKDHAALGLTLNLSPNSAHLGGYW